MNKIKALNLWASRLSLDQISNLSEDEILNKAMERPGYPGQFGFMLQLQSFSSQEHFAETMRALLKRIGQVENLQEKMKNRI